MNKVKGFLLSLGIITVIGFSFDVAGMDLFGGVTWFFPVSARDRNSTSLDYDRDPKVLFTGDHDEQVAVSSTRERPQVQALETDGLFGDVVDTVPYKSVTPVPCPEFATEPDNTKDIKNFWAKGYQAQWLSQTNPQDGTGYFKVFPGETIFVDAEFKNTGDQVWCQFPLDSGPNASRAVLLAVYKDPKVKSSWTGRDDPNNPQYGTSDFGGSFLDASSFFKSFEKKRGSKVATLLGSVVPHGEVGSFRMEFSIPFDAPVGRFREDITLASGKYWVESVPETADPIGAAHIWVGFDIQDPKDTSSQIRTLHLTNMMGDQFKLSFDTSKWEFVEETVDYPMGKAVVKRLKFKGVDYNFGISLRSVPGSYSFTKPAEKTFTAEDGSQGWIRELYNGKTLVAEEYASSTGRSVLVADYKDVPSSEVKRCQEEVLKVVKTVKGCEWFSNECF